MKEKNRKIKHAPYPFQAALMHFSRMPMPVSNHLICNGKALGPTASDSPSWSKSKNPKLLSWVRQIYSLTIGQIDNLHSALSTDMVITWYLIWSDLIKFHGDLKKLQIATLTQSLPLTPSVTEWAWPALQFECAEWVLPHEEKIHALFAIQTIGHCSWLRAPHRAWYLAKTLIQCETINMPCQCCQCSVFI
jgi:hypothetical protein